MKDRYSNIGSMACNAVNEYRLTHVFGYETKVNPLSRTETVKNKLWPFVLMNVPLSRWSEFSSHFFIARLKLSSSLKQAGPTAVRVGIDVFWDKFSNLVDANTHSVDHLSDSEIANKINETVKSFTEE